MKNLLEIPGAVAVMLSTPQLKKLVDWGYKSVPQTSAWGRVIPQTRGRVLGGSSSVNGMLFVRGNRQNFDDWAADGAEAGRTRTCCPRSSGSKTGRTAPASCGGRGPVKVRRQKDLTEASRSFIDAATDRLAVPFLDDYNGPEQEGVGVFQLSADRGVRYSAARAYLRTDPPDNLLVLTDADAARIVLSGGRATGVEVVGADGERQVIAADREVIVSAGVFGSPKPQLSGIGHGAPAAARHRGGQRPAGGRQPARPPVRPGLLPDGLGAAAADAGTSCAGSRGRGCTACWASGSQFEATGFVRSSLSGAIPDLQLHALYWVYPFPNQDGDKAVRPPTSKPGLASSRR